MHTFGPGAGFFAPEKKHLEKAGFTHIYGGALRGSALGLPPRLCEVGVLRGAATEPPRICV